jgi:hypothetical protein
MILLIIDSLSWCGDPEPVAENPEMRPGKKMDEVLEYR